MEWPGDCPLNEADCNYLRRVLTEMGPRALQQCKCCEEVGLPIPQVAENINAAMAQARLMLEKFFPGRAPVELTRSESVPS